MIEASNGAEGLRFARDEQPQLILLDLLMPDPGGFEVLERLRADPNTAEIPVVVSTSKIAGCERSARAWIARPRDSFPRARSATARPRRNCGASAAAWDWAICCRSQSVSPTDA